MLQLNCVAQNYAWGIKGEESAVARFKKASDSTFCVKQEDCYAELWMGTHPSGPSKLLEDGTLLSRWLEKNPSSVGIVPEGYPADNLPFLFKVLSVQTALSIQTHPDKSLAAQLHSKYPDVYKDPNHKPEMVIAITPFECMCGFRTLSEIRTHMNEFPELDAVINHNGDATMGTSSGDESEQLKSLFGQYMSCPPTLVLNHLAAMITRLTHTQSSRTLTAEEDLILRLNTQYPNDIGVFSPLIMNYLRLQPGQSFFIGANELHAYISGECVECMALSDNVVRAGLTPKFKDCETLCNMLVYKSRLPSYLTPIGVDSCTSLYRPPADCCAEFEVELIEVPPHSQYSPVVVNCGCILLLLRCGDAADTAEGKVTVSHTTSSNSTEGATEQTPLSLQVGAVVFTAAAQQVSIVVGAGGATFYRAHVNLGGACAGHTF